MAIALLPRFNWSWQFRVVTAGRWLLPRPALEAPAGGVPVLIEAPVAEQWQGDPEVGVGTTRDRFRLNCL